jgi:exopolyphosphatase/guanosine-5'-triphosphate,3'-diphosphate pyrophosphatase
MDIFELEGLEICPWALREGIILERLDRIGVVEGRNPPGR